MKETKRWARRRLCLAAVMTGVALQMSGAEPTYREIGDDEGGRTMIFMEAVTGFRENAADKPEQTVAFYFTQSALAKWKVKVSAEMNAQQLADFFAGAVVLSGPQTGDESISALYNPWWDGILFLRLKAVEKTAAAAAHVDIAEFHLLSGETFRGESAGGDVSHRTVVPELDPLSVELWRVTSGTVARFKDWFPMDGRISFGKLIRMLASLDEARERERLQTRSALRLKLSLMLLKNARDAGLAAVMTNLLRTGNSYQLYTHFDAAETHDLVRTFAEMPEMFRKDFTPYGYVPTADGILFTFVNAKVPRLFATITYPKDRTKRRVSMEWYDLTRSAELLAVWNARGKEVAK